MAKTARKSNLQILNIQSFFSSQNFDKRNALKDARPKFCIASEYNFYLFCVTQMKIVSFYVESMLDKKTRTNSNLINLINKKNKFNIEN